MDVIKFPVLPSKFKHQNSDFFDILYVEK